MPNPSDHPVVCPTQVLKNHEVEWWHFISFREALKKIFFLNKKISRFLKLCFKSILGRSESFW